MIEFRESYVRNQLGIELLVNINEEGLKLGIDPAENSEKHTEIMKTESLKAALTKHGFDAAFGGARRDEEKSRAKERVFSFRDKFHRWDPKNQRPELWNLYNTRVNPGESIRVFPYPTGRNWMFGSTSILRISRFKIVFCCCPTCRESRRDMDHVGR